MTTILSSSVSTPSNSVLICWNTVATTLYMSFRGELFALGAWSDLILIVGCASREGGTHFFHCGWSGLCKLWRLSLLRSTAAKNSPGVVWLEENISSFTNLKLHHVGIDVTLPFSGNVLCRLPPSHHTQRRSCLQLAKIWPNFWQFNTAWGQSELCTPLSSLQYGKGLSFLTSPRILRHGHHYEQEGRFTVDFPPAGIQQVAANVHQLIWDIVRRSCEWTVPYHRMY
jgi:hypothetical protein